MPIKNFGTGTPRLNEGMILSGSATLNYLNLYASGAIEVAGQAVFGEDVEVGGVLNINQHIKHIGDEDTLITFNDNQIVLKAGNLALVTAEKNSSAPHEVTINDGSNNVDFVVKGNNSNQGNPGMKFDASTNKLGINGVGTPTYELDVDGDIGLSEYIYHNGDDDTFIRFEDDEITISAGGRSFINLQEASTDKLVINNGGLDIDLQVKGENDANLIRTEAEFDSIYFGASSGAGSDNNFFVSGSINSKGTSERGTAAFGGDLVASGAFNASLGLSGSLTRLTDGTSYLVAGTNVTITSASNGQVTIAASSGGGGGSGPAGSNTEVQFNDGGANFGASSNFTYDGTQLTVSSTGLNPIFNLSTTNDGATASPIFTLKRNSSSPADADYLGQIKFQGENDADQEVAYAKITGKIDDASDGSEDGILEFANIKAGSQTITARLRSDALQLLNSTDLTVDGKVGVGVTTPDRSLEVINSNEPQMRITHTDNSKYVDFQADEAGDLVVTASNSNATYRFTSAGHCAMILQSDATDGDAELGFSVDGGATLDFSMGVDDGDSDKFKIGTSTIGTNTRLTIDSSGKVGIGITAPDSTLHVHADSINDGAVTISQADDSGDASQLDLSKARGTGASPSAVQNSDFIGQVRFLAYDGNSYDNFADIFTQAAGTISTTSHPTKLVIRTTQASATSPTTAVTIDENQDMTVVGAVYGKMMHMTHHRYNDGSGTGKEYIPWSGTSEQASPNYITQGVAPYTGRLVKVLLRSSKTPTMGNTVVGIHIGTDGNATHNTSAEETVTVNMASANTTGVFNFTNSNHFAAGDVISVSVDPTGAHGNVNVTCVWEYAITI